MYAALPTRPATDVAESPCAASGHVTGTSGSALDLTERRERRPATKVSVVKITSAAQIRTKPIQREAGMSSCMTATPHAIWSAGG